MSIENKDELVNIVKWGLISCGAWRRPLHVNMFLKFLNAIYSRVVVLSYAAFYIGIFAEMMRLFIQGYDGPTVMASFSIVVTCSKIVTIVIIYVKNNVLGLLDDVSKNEEDIWRENNTEIIGMYKKYLKMGKLFSRVIWISTFLAVLSVNVSGIIGNHYLKIYNAEHNVSIESHHLYKFYFPANRLDWEVTVTAISIYISYIAMIYYVTTNMILVVLCINSASNLTILQHRLRNYIPEDFKEDQIMDQTISTLRDIISQHLRLIEFTEHLNKRCKSIIMVEFILSSLDIALGALGIIKINLADMGWIVFYFPMVIGQIYGLAWSANEVYIQSQGVADAAYESRWYDLNKHGKVLTKLIIQRAQQRPQVMTIGPFGPMTLESFLVVMKAAYSYISIMRRNKD